ncbi:MAG: hypothetical protein AAB152_17820 [Candidatus Coatesbacteria bacterium]
MHEKRGKDWKGRLLSSGLPLEQMVAEVLADRRMLLCGPYSYSRKTVAAEHPERSVDIRASALLAGIPGIEGWIEMLAECKYSNPNIRWVFSPITSFEESFANTFCCFDQLSGVDIDERELLGAVRGWPCCGRGVAVSDDSEDARQIARGLEQVRYATASLLGWHFAIALEAIKGDGSRAIKGDGVVVLLPLLVTNAELWVLRRGVDLETFYGASALEEVADKAKLIVCYEQAGSEMRGYCREQVDSLRSNYPNADNEIGEMARKLDLLRRPIHTYWGFSYSLRMLQEIMVYATQKVLVVSLSALPSCVPALLDTINDAAKHAHRYGGESGEG